jgi:hypothetical protein
MSELNTAGLNGTGRLAVDVANHVALVLVARLMAAIGVPIAMWLFVEVWNGLEEIETAVRANTTSITVHEFRLGENERRVSTLERLGREDR